MNPQPRTISWILAATGLVAISVVLIGLNGSAGSMLAGGVVVGLFTALLWLSWHREQPRSASPMSEYLAVGYLAAWYLTLPFTWAETGDNWADMLLILPPVSWLPLVSRLAVGAFKGRQPQHRTLRRLHRLTAGVLLLAVAYFVVSIIAIIVSPVPLVAGVLHLAAARSYARRVQDA